MPERHCKLRPDAVSSRTRSPEPLPTILWEPAQSRPTSEVGTSGIFTFNMPPRLESLFNIDHMGFLVRYPFSSFVLDVDQKGTQLALRADLGIPCLRLENLAMSARLASQVPANSPFYLARAVHLEAQAVKSFDSMCMHIDSSNCVVLLLFTSILGRHLLIDTLAQREPDLPRFLDCWVWHVVVYRGLRAVASKA